MIVLSKRLAASAAFVAKNSRVADVGCDHAYTSIYLIQNGIAKYCIAMDIKEGPLSKARENILHYRCGDKIETRLSDGLAKLSVGEADTILISGMGGLLIQKILAESPDVVKEVKELILQPQSDQEKVRRFLHQIGFAIVEETMLCEDGKYYVSIHAVNRCGNGLEHYGKKIDYLFGKPLLEQKDGCLLEYLQNRQQKYDVVCQNMKEHGKTEDDTGYRGIMEKLFDIEEALELYQIGE